MTAKLIATIANMKELYFTLLLMLVKYDSNYYTLATSNFDPKILQVAGLAFSTVVNRKAPRQNLSPSGNSPVHQTSERLKRQTTGFNWVTGPFSEVSSVAKLGTVLYMPCP